MELLGFAAGTLVAASLLPQVIKSWRTKSTKDLSLAWTLINLAGQALWLVYGLSISSVSLVVMSAITFCFTLSLIVLKLRRG
jgi:MtN3 and saliva related transmembrane protein